MSSRLPVLALLVLGACDPVDESAPAAPYGGIDVEDVTCDTQGTGSALAFTLPQEGMVLQVLYCEERSGDQEACSQDGIDTWAQTSGKVQYRCEEDDRGWARIIWAPML